VEKIAPQILALLDDHFHLQKQWVSLSGGRAFVGAVLELNLTAMAGTITNALGKRHWSVCPPLGFGIGEGVGVEYLPVSGEFEGKRLKAYQTEVPGEMAPTLGVGMWKSSDKHKKLIGRSKILGLAVRTLYNPTAYKFIKLKRDYTYLRRRLGITYLEIPSHLRGQPEAEITPLPFKKK
jgi:hypothetical protein